MSTTDCNIIEARLMREANDHKDPGATMADDEDERTWVTNPLPMEMEITGPRRSACASVNVAESEDDEDDGDGKLDALTSSGELREGNGGGGGGGFSLLPRDQRWCSCFSACSVVLLSALLVVGAAYIILQATPVLDAVADEDGVRDWLSVTSAVEGLVWFFVLPAWGLSILTLVRITCRWRTTVASAVASEKSRLAMDSRTACKALWDMIRFYTSPRSPFFFWELFFWECNEFVWQALAIEQMSRNGAGMVALVLYTMTILVNGSAPAILFWITWQLQRRKQARKQQPRAQRTQKGSRRLQDQQSSSGSPSSTNSTSPTSSTAIADDDSGDGSFAARWIARVLLFDACCVLLYTAFPLLHAFIRLVHVYFLGHGEARFVREFLDATKNATQTYPTGAQKEDDLMPLLFLSEMRYTCFGGTSWDIVVKFVSRVSPLFTAPIQVELAFVTWAAAETMDDEPGRVQRRRRWTIGSLFDGGTSKRRGVGNYIQRRVRQSARRLVKKEVMKRLGKYKRVPGWAAAAFIAAICAFALVVFIRLSTWGECADLRIRQSCAVRAFPIFRFIDEEDRNCACNTLTYLDRSCLDDQLLLRNSSHGAAGSEPPASHVLNQTTILGSTVTIFMAACPGDAQLLETLARRLERPSVIMIITAAKQPGGPLWEVPSSFGLSPVDGSPWNSLHVLVLENMRIGNFAARLENAGAGLKQLSIEYTNLTGLTDEAVANLENTMIVMKVTGSQMTRLPAPVGQMTKLQVLRLNHNLLQTIPKSIGRLSRLEALDIRENNITSLPDSIRYLTGLEQLRIQRNRLNALAAGIFELSSIKSFDASSNLLTTVPSGIEKMTKLEELILYNNRLRDLPATMGTLTALKSILAYHNDLNRIPSSFGNLRQLEYLDLAHNNATAALAEILRLPKLSCFALESNPIPGRSVVEAIDGMSTRSSSSSSSSTHSSAWFLANSPACSQNGSTGGAENNPSNTIPGHAGQWEITCTPWNFSTRLHGENPSICQWYQYQRDQTEHPGSAHHDWRDPCRYGTWRCWMGLEET